MATKVTIQPPDLRECKTYEAFKRELKCWQSVTDLPVEKQGNYIALALPNKCKFGEDLKERVLENLTDEDLSSAEGLVKVIAFLDNELGKNAVDDVIEKWEDFDNCTKASTQALDEFITDFESKYNRVKVTGTKLPEEILAYMLMKRAGLSHLEKTLILARVDIENKEGLFKDVKINMKNILGKRLQEKEQKEKIEQTEFKLDVALLAQHEDVLAAHGYYRNNFKNKPGKYPTKKNNVKRTDKSGREMNPIGKDGKTMTCRGCGSFRHLLKQCQHSHENNPNSVLLTEHSESDSETESDFERFVLFTTDRDEISNFTAEALNSAALDTCCTTTVAGQNWIKIYLDSLSDESRKLVKGPMPSDKHFKGVNQGIMTALEKYIIPAEIGENAVMIEVDIVEADIPMLLSKTAMKNAKMVIHMDQDYAEVLGKTISLNTTSAGHYVIPLLKRRAKSKVEDDHILEIEDVLAVDLKSVSSEEKEKTLHKLHKQFGHRPKDSFITLLKNANAWTPDMHQIITKIIEGCEGCIKRKRNPDRPTVAMPMASEFNQKVAIDLSFYQGTPILHMIDMYSRLTISAKLNRKKPSEVIDQILSKWVAYFGVPLAILNDNGGEFTAEEVCEMKAILNIVDLTTAAESPWQNGVCEKNHALVDNILERLDEDYPRLDLDTKLSWACMAKNSLQMVYGFSPNQLVFGQNPKLPNVISDPPPSWEDSTVSEVLARHLNLLHATRRAFLKSESCTKMKNALKAKITCNEVVYEPGDILYYKRAKDNKWIGPAKVVFQDGKIIFVRSGSTFVRVSTNRAIKAGTELAKKIAADMAHPEDGQKMIEGNNEDTAAQEKAIHPEEVITDNTNDASSKSSVVRDAEESIQDHGDAVDSNQDTASVKSLKKGDRIQMTIDNETVTGTVTGRAGRATGKYKDWYNISRDDGTAPHSIDLQAVAVERLPPAEEAFLVLIPKKNQNTTECHAAKLEELKKLKDFGTYEEVPLLDQDYITSTWVVAQKGSGIKARLVARGFEDDTDQRTDSPTMSKAAFRVLLTIAASKQWAIQMTDIKSAFLQGQDLNRDIYLLPPKEADAEGSLWKLKKGLYGLKEASRLWYDKVKSCLAEQDCTEVASEPGLFICKDRQGKVIGVVGVHVDDFLHIGGSKEFQEKVIGRIHDQFQVGKNERTTFTYTGFEIHQTDNGILLNQEQYLADLIIPEISAAREKEKQDSLSEAETTHLRKMAGCLNWIVRGSRPDLSFMQILSSTKFKDGKVEDLVRIRKALIVLKEDKATLMYPDLGETSDWLLLCFTDAAFGNLNDGVNSTGGHIILLANRKTGDCCALDWQTNKIKRVVRSTLAAETLSLCDGIENAVHLRDLLHELTGQSEIIPMIAVVDNLSLTEAAHSTTPVSDKRLRRELGLIKEHLNNKSSIQLKWVPGKQQLADVLTKMGVDGSKLLKVVQLGHLDITTYE